MIILNDINKPTNSSDRIYGKRYQRKTAVKSNDVTANYADQASMKADPQGSWTGKPAVNGEKPVQDADDM